MKIIKPTADRVYIEPLEEKETTYGNIIVPDLGNEKIDMGTVVAVGSGRTTEFGIFIPTTIKVGEIVSYPKFGSQKFSLNGKEYVVCKETEITAIIEENDK